MKISLAKNFKFISHEIHRIELAENNAQYSVSAVLSFEFYYGI